MDSGKFPVPVSTLPLEHLAAVFEHFLGTRMQVAEGYRVKRTGKSAVLYTGSVNIPAQPVVEYVVKETIGDMFRKQGTGVRTGIRSLIPHVEPGSFCSLLTGSSPVARTDIRFVRYLREKSGFGLSISLWHRHRSRLCQRGTFRNAAFVYRRMPVVRIWSYFIRWFAGNMRVPERYNPMW